MSFKVGERRNFVVFGLDVVAIVLGFQRQRDEEDVSSDEDDYETTDHDELSSRNSALDNNAKKTRFSLGTTFGKLQNICICFKIIN